MTSGIRPESQDGRHYRAALGGNPWDRRKTTLKDLFEGISPKYDRLNRFLSFGLDRSWRRWAISGLNHHQGGLVLDLASGTGDMAMILAEKPGRPILRCDLSGSLLQIGSAKLSRGSVGQKTRLSPPLAAEMERLPLPDGSVDAIMQGFALRHCRLYDSFFAELFRVLKPEGILSLLDMRYPATGPGSGLYRFYFRVVLPRLAALLGGDRLAYEMMVDSVRSLPSESELMDALARAGFTRVESRPGFLGAVRLLRASRPAQPSSDRS